MAIKLTWRKKFIIKGPNEQYYKRVVADLIKIDKTKQGKHVIAGLMGKGTVDIWHFEKLCAFMPLGARGRRIAYDPDFFRKKIKPLEFDPTVGILIKKQMTFVYLYHELVHALRYATKNYIEHPDGPGKAFSIRVSHPEEFTTTGLYEYADYGLSENNYRKQLGLPRRPYYATDKKLEVYEREIERRMFRRLPDPPKYRREELVFGGDPKKNPYNKKIDAWKLGMYIALDYEDYRKRYPKGYPDKGHPTPEDFQSYTKRHGLRD